MTIALVIKVNDGVVLAADSAASITFQNANGSIGVSNVYNNANKVFNLHKELPIGAMTWGLGNIGPASISTITKDVRQRFHGTPADTAWKIDALSYGIGAVAAQVHEHISGRYGAMTDDLPEGTDHPYLGLLVVGYSSDDDAPHVYVMNFDGANDGTPIEVITGGAGAQWWGQPEAISRILNGFSLDAPNALVDMAIGLDQVQATDLIMQLQNRVGAQVVNPAMPIQDAIDLAQFLVYATIQYVRFTPSPLIVGGPIEIATITKHEGFKWVSRKHYYDGKLNPQEKL